ncbi:MAG: TfoX/Sxy family protein [Solirubrobacterales bacterium]
MAYEEALADRVRDILIDVDGVTERKMFGGLAFMVNGNMLCGPIGENLMVRVGPSAYEEALTIEGASEMRFTGKPMRGFVDVDGQALADDSALKAWVERGLAFAQSLPPK